MVIVDDIRFKSLLLFGGTSRSEMIKALASDGASAVVILRASQWSYRNRLVVLGYLLSRINTFVNGIVVGRGAEFGAGLVLQHPIGVVINGHAVLGRNCVIQSNVTIGAKDRQSPVLGDAVEIGSGARLIGGIAIGNRVRIGANAVVVKDAADDQTLVGVPAKALVT